MKAREYRLIEMCVEQGLRHGHNRAHKHSLHPSEEQIFDAQRDAVMLEIGEWFVFEELE
jgi:hypothetical protein